jgi:diguanylate cyclase (GGDEF)-like protein
MFSFKAKLAVYFLLLSLLPIAAVFWAFSSVTSRSETRRVDARLEAGMRAALTAYQHDLDARRATATRLARERDFQQALEHTNLAALKRLLRGTDDVEVILPHGRRVGAAPAPTAATARADVRTRKGLAGSIVASLPLDSSLAEALHRSSGLDPSDVVAILDGTRVVAASLPLSGAIAAHAGVPASTTVSGAGYRVLASGALLDHRQLRLATLSPQHPIDTATSAARDRLLLFLGLALLAIGLIAYTQGRAIAGNLKELVAAARDVAEGRLAKRVPVRGRDELAELGRAFNDMAEQLEERLDELQAERARLRGAFMRFGDALSATHDTRQLLRVVLEAAVEATHATGAALIDPRGEIIDVGDLDSTGERLELPLAAGKSTFGTLILVAPGFGEEERLTANSLVSHAVVALENARLHGIVERQALVDGLTGLANRRHCEESLASELARAERLDTPLTAILADLDGFKQINDELGHTAGDVVLREFADVLRANLREADVAGRWGGEEFLLLLPGTDLAGGVRLAERVRARFEGRVMLSPDGTPMRLTCSLGIASYPVSPDAVALLRDADAALYHAKRAGKNRVEVAVAAAARP